MFAQNGAGLLIQLLDLGRDLIARNDAHRLNQTKGETACQTLQRLIAGHRHQRFKLRRDLAVDKVLHAAAHLVGDIGAGLFVNENLDLRLGGLGPLDQFAHRRGAPHQAALRGEIQLCIG